MTCAKVTVTCTIIAPDGRRYVGTNYCHEPQTTCPRLPGEGYAKCLSLCQQLGHAEVVALLAAGGNARGGHAYVEYTHLCRHCQESLVAAGVSTFTIGAPPP